MKLNNFIDKTLKAAKQSAQQIYGDDFSKLKENISENGQEQEQNFSNGQDSLEDEEDSDPQKELIKKSERNGVVFERSEPAQKQPNKTKLQGKLDTIRKYAAEQSNEDISVNHDEASDMKSESKKKKDQPEIKIPKPVSELYSRKDIRPKQSVPKKKEIKKDKQQEAEKSGENNPVETKKSDSKELYDQLVDDLPNGISGTSERSESDKEKVEQTNDEQDQDLHKRLERLEVLVEGNLSSAAGNARSTNPIYHKLIQRGVPQNLVNSWFDLFKQQGIDPNKQQDLFGSKLLHLISQKLQPSQAGPIAKMLVLTGRSGSGKSSLAIKLATIPHFLGTNNIAVVSFVPDSEDLRQNFSIVKPFCRNNNIDFYEIGHATEAAAYRTEWEMYDHILFDTPALETGGQALTSAITDLTDELQSQATVETQYLVNTSVQGTAFNDPLAKEIAADHVCLTHLDQSTKWGKALPLLFNTEYKLRYIGSGPSLSGDLLPFDTEKFTRKLLRA